MTQVIQVHSVVLGDAVRNVAHQWNVDLAQTALLPRCIDPRQMGKVRIDAGGNDFGVQLLELLDPVREGKDFRRAHEGKVQRVEEEHQILAPVVGQLDLLECSLHHGGRFEIRGRTGYHGLGPLELMVRRSDVFLGVDMASGK